MAPWRAATRGHPAPPEATTKLVPVAGSGHCPGGSWRVPAFFWGSWEAFWDLVLLPWGLQGRLPGELLWLRCCCLPSEPWGLFLALALSPGSCPVSPELPENWTDTRETLLEGMLFTLKYLGMTLVEQPKGEELSAAAVKRIVATAKASGKKLQKVTLMVSPRGIVLRDSSTNELIENISIYRISYCTADKSHDKVFAYIAQNQLNESLECHAFLCSKRKMAQAVTLTVAQAFRIAFEFWQAAKEEKEKRERSILAAGGTSSPGSDSPAHPVPGETAGMGRGMSLSRDGDSLREMDDGLDEAFSRLAQSRTNPQVLDTGLTAQDMQSAQTLSPVDWNQVEPSRAERDELFMF
ncbi:PREDICTED: low density lipoprotein receptor adapter protein 1 [Ficedula albicollis]|uniref:low density lipoprotein receptor adapter protein 1 n=1 Tax=Ficedula albicollis TaxID=59894 RepID=UPI0007AD7E54|nr:PREDICTED: low density lipoprotein receptor adapter protein 1 [Ficedula albicollis]